MVALRTQRDALGMAHPKPERTQPCHQLHELELVPMWGQRDVPTSPPKLGALELERIRLPEPLLAPLWPGWREEARAEAGGGVGVCRELSVLRVVFQGELK